MNHCPFCGKEREICFLLEIKPRAPLGLGPDPYFTDTFACPDRCDVDMTFYREPTDEERKKWWRTPIADAKDGDRTLNTGRAKPYHRHVGAFLLSVINRTWDTAEGEIEGKESAILTTDSKGKRSIPFIEATDRSSDFEQLQTEDEVRGFLQREEELANAG